MAESERAGVLLRLPVRSERPGEGRNSRACATSACRVSSQPDGMRMCSVGSVPRHASVGVVGTCASARNVQNYVGSRAAGGWRARLLQQASFQP